MKSGPWYSGTDAMGAVRGRQISGKKLSLCRQHLLNGLKLYFECQFSLEQGFIKEGASSLVSDFLSHGEILLSCCVPLMMSSRMLKRRQEVPLQRLNRETTQSWSFIL